MWYRVVRASRYLGVVPWELEQQPMTWVLAAEEAQAAEAAARRAAEKRGEGGRNRRGASRPRP